MSENLTTGVASWSSLDSVIVTALLEAKPLGFAFFDNELRCRRINDTLADLLGVSADDLVGRTLTQTLPGVIAATIAGFLSQIIETRRADIDKVLELPLPIGSDEHEATERRVWTTTWLPSFGQDRTVVGVALIAVDVTDRRRLEDPARRTEERYQSVVKANSQVIWVTDPVGRITDDAPEWRAITGQSFEEYKAGGWLHVVHPEDRARVEAGWHECLADPSRTFETTYRIRTTLGTYRHYDVRAVPIWRGTEVLEWVGANTDITAERQAEELRGQLIEKLSAAALRTARLQQATSMLAEAPTVGQVVQVITEVGRSAIGADRSAMALLDDDRRLWLIAPADVTELGEGRDSFSVSDPTVMSYAVRENKPFIAENPEDLRLRLGEGTGDAIDTFLQDTDERAWIGLPLIGANQPIGALRFAFTQDHQVSEEERVFLEALAGQCALAIERALLFERQHEAAELGQRAQEALYRQAFATAEAATPPYDVADELAQFTAWLDTNPPSTP